MTETSGPAADTATPPPAPSRGRQALHNAYELLSSMRFAITLLCVICIASVIGTVVKQGEPLNNYINQFGPFWAEVYGRFGLFTVYSSGWFLLILGFLVLSTSLCIARNAPKIVADLRSFKEDIRASALKAFHHKGQGELPLGREAALQQVSAVLARRGWQARAQVREDGTMVAARTGRANKLGYLAAHSAVVLICLGGLSDGDLIVRLQMALTGKSVFDGGGLISQVAPSHRLPAGNPTFRGNLLVPEGQRAGVAVLTMPDGIVLQDLPFDVELKKFIVDYYDTGMPKLFASDIVIHDRETGQAIPATVKVNEPASWRGVQIYQSSFEDGGSLLRLKAQPLAGGAVVDLQGRVGDTLTLSRGSEKLTIELTGLKTINVENLGGGADAGTDVRKVDLADTLGQHLGSGAARPDKARTLHNIGPAFSYKLVDASGQRREFNNYMQPVELDGRRVFLFGMREALDDSFRYLRIPADEHDAPDGWLRLRNALMDPAQREAAAQRYAKAATPPGKPEMAAQLQTSARRALDLFAGAESPQDGKPATGGLDAFTRFIDHSVPQADRAKVADVLLRILNGALFELAQLSREHAGLPPLANDEHTETFMTQAVLALSDAVFYPAPVILTLAGFDQLQASVFQVARAPGKKLVYLGAVLLIIGVFAMLYIRERRLWIWLADAAAPGQTQVTVAMSTPRRTLDIDADFEALKAELLGGTPAS